MGSGATTDRAIPPEWMGIFSAMQFTKAEVLNFQLIFDSVDEDENGRIGVDELLKFLCIEKSLFAVRIFGAFDRYGTGRIDLFEFVVALWKFCALGPDSIVIFAFDLYDTDCDGVLTETEMKVVFHDLYWYGTEPEENRRSRTLLEDFMGLGEGVITMEQFRSFCKHNTGFLTPIFAVQDKLRAAAMGRPFWKTVSQRHVVLGLGRRVTLGNLIVETVDRELFYQLLHDQSTHSFYNVMKSFFDNVQQSLHLTSPDDVSECPTQDAALERLFRPALKSPNESDEHDPMHGCISHVATRSLSTDDERTVRLGHSL